MHIIEIYRRRRLPWSKWQYFWRCVYKKGAINNVVATGAEGYYNLTDLEASLRNFCNKAPVAEWKYAEDIVR